MDLQGIVHTYIDLGTMIHHTAREAFIILRMWGMLHTIALGLLRTV